MSYAASETDSSPKRNSRRRWLLWSFVLVLTGAAIGVGWLSSREHEVRTAIRELEHMGLSVSRNTETVLFGVISLTKSYSVRRSLGIQRRYGLSNTDLETIGRALSTLRGGSRCEAVLRLAADESERASEVR